MTSKPRSKFVPISEIAAALEVSRMTVYRLINSGDLPAYQIGRSKRVFRDDAEAYLRGTRIGSDITETVKPGSRKPGAA